MAAADTDVFRNAAYPFFAMKFEHSQFYVECSTMRECPGSAFEGVGGFPTQRRGVSGQGIV